MYTFLVEFDCLVVSEPYYLYIKANSLQECWNQANKISFECSELSTGSFEIYRLMTPDDYEQGVQ